MEDRLPGAAAHGFDVWQDPFVPLRLPKLFNLRADPFEIGDQEAMDYGHWRVDRVFLLVPAQAYVAQFLATFKEFPPRQKVGTFSLDRVLEELRPKPTTDGKRRSGWSLGRKGSRAHSPAGRSDEASGRPS